MTAARERVTRKAGDVLFLAKGTFHAARNVTYGPGAELATCVVEKEQAADRVREAVDHYRIREAVSHFDRLLKEFPTP